MLVQVHHCLTLVPGKAIGGIIDVYKQSWSVEMQQLLPDLHAMVVSSLKQQNDLAEEQEQQMQAHLTRLRTLLCSDTSIQT